MQNQQATMQKVKTTFNTQATHLGLNNSDREQVINQLHVIASRTPEASAIPLEQLKVQVMQFEQGVINNSISKVNFLCILTCRKLI